MTKVSESSTQNSSPANSPQERLARRSLSLVTLLVVGCLICVVTILSHGRARDLTSSVPDDLTATATQEMGRDFSNFSHTSRQHSRLPCLLCHRRPDNSPQLRLPGHLPCAGCHTQQFADAGSPICAICHTDAQTGQVKLFPALKSFNVKFDHARHSAGAARPGAGCVACHKPTSRGVAFSIPAGLNGHAACYQCHAPQAKNLAGQDIASCSTCHQLGRYARTPAWAQAYRVNFSHVRHTRQRLSCTDCHNIKAGLPQARQVTAPAPLQHHAPARAESCMTCHNNRRAFGGDDFTDCTRCHQGAHFYF